MPGKSVGCPAGRIDGREQSRYLGPVPRPEDNVMIRPGLRFGLSLLILAALAAPTQAQLYKWVDSSGRVQYSDRPPPGGSKAEQVSNANVSAIGAQGSAGGAQRAADLEADFRKRRAEQAEAAKKQQQAQAEHKQKAESCAAARRNLAALQSGQRMVKYNEKGEPSFVDDAGRARELQQAEQQIRTYCN